MSSKKPLGQIKITAALLAFPLLFTPLAVAADQPDGFRLEDGTSSSAVQPNQEKVTRDDWAVLQNGQVLSRLILMENHGKIAEVMAKLANQPLHRVTQSLRDEGTHTSLARNDVMLSDFSVTIASHWEVIVRNAQD